MVDPDLPATQPIPIIDPEKGNAFLARLRDHTVRTGRALDLLTDLN